MTALTKDTNRVYELGDINQLPVMGGQIIYQGAAVGVHPYGYAKRLEYGDTFAGFAEEHVNNSAGSDGTKTVRIKKRGAVLLNIPGVTMNHINQSIFGAEDDNFTFDGNYPYVGKISRVEPNEMALVEFIAGLLP